MTHATPTPVQQQAEPAPTPIRTPSGAGPIVMTVFGVLLFAAGYAIIAIAPTDSSLNALGGLMFAIVGGLLWVGGRINARINAWGRYNASQR